MRKKTAILVLSILSGAILISASPCVGQMSALTTSPSKILPVTVEVAGVERLNDIAATPPFQKTDTLVFRVNFRLLNPNDVLAKMEDFDFEVKVEDGTPDKTIVLTGSMPACVIQPNGEMMWSGTEPYIYGGVLGSYMLRGLGGADGVKGAAQKLEELWKDLGSDKRKFSIDGKISSSFPDFPNLGMVHQRFSAEFTIPKL
ncbi:MAG: hypothetical protein WCO26_06035 [Deltaproteobacteria bacterium]